MIRSSYIIVCLFISVLIARGQEVVSVDRISSISPLSGQLFLATFGFDLELDYTAVVSRVTYTTTGSDMHFNGSMPIMIYHHGTTDGRDDVPSNLRGFFQVGALFAGKGMAVVAPDLLGLGTSRGFHPYVHADTEASASVDMVDALRSFMEDNDLQWNNQLFISGYSQGGHSAMATHRYIEVLIPDRYTVTASLPMSGPYSISGIMRDLAFREEPYTFPAYLIYTTRGLREINPSIYNDESEIYKDEFLEDISAFLASGTGLFDLNESLVQTLIDTEGVSIPRRMFRDSFLNAIEFDDNHPFNQALRESDVFDWIPQAPILMLYCPTDEQVPYTNSLLADSIMNLNGARDVRSMDVSEGVVLDHLNCTIPAWIEGVPWILSFVITSSLPPLLAPSEVTVYPNPADNVLVISSEEESIEYIEIYSMDGRLILKESIDRHEATIDINNLDTGIYLTHIIREDGRVLKKIIVQH